MSNSRSIAGRILLIMALCLMVCAFTHVPVASANGAGGNDPITRPFSVEGYLFALDFEAGFPWTILDQGWCSEIGRYVSVSKWSSLTEAFGVLIAPNGDQVFWELSPVGVVFTGGTGRFKNVSGGFIITELVDLPFAKGPNGTLMNPATYRGEGTITY